MSDRDKMAVIVYDMTDNYYPPTMGKCRDIADVLWAAGWRKMPSASEMQDCIISVDDQRDTDVLVAAVLALLGGPSEKGGGDVG